MLNKVIIKSRKQIEQHINSKIELSKNKHALISIWSFNELITFSNRHVLNDLGCSEILSINFGDLTPKDRIEEHQILFSEKEAKIIINFVDKINLIGINELFIHCAAGISRSPAVGLFVCKYFNLDENEFRKINLGILPNFHVLNVLNEVSGINSNYAKIWITKENLRKRNLMIKLAKTINRHGRVTKLMSNFLTRFFRQKLAG